MDEAVMNKASQENTSLPIPAYTSAPARVVESNGCMISDFTSDAASNVDEEVVASFGEEWSKFHAFADDEIQEIGSEYFDILPPALLRKNTTVLDVGCGTGRWSKYLAPKVGFVDAVDPSKAIFAASSLLRDHDNVRLTIATSDTLPFSDNSYDLVMSIGVLHHIPNTLAAMKDCVAKVKPGGFFYTYLYYKLDNRNRLFKTLFTVVNTVRKKVSSLSPAAKKLTCDALAVAFYMPLVLSSRFLFTIGLKKASDALPLSYYRDKSFFIIRNDALDRFGTSLEQRFSRDEIETMLRNCGLTNIRVADTAPFWHVIAQKP